MEWMWDRVKPDSWDAHATAPTVAALIFGKVREEGVDAVREFLDEYSPVQDERAWFQVLSTGKTLYARSRRAYREMFNFLNSDDVKPSVSARTTRLVRSIIDSRKRGQSEDSVSE